MSPRTRKRWKRRAKQIEFTADVKETGERKNIAGHETRRSSSRIAGHEKGRTVEESRRLRADRTTCGSRRGSPAMDEMNAVQLKFVKSVYGEAFVANMQ